MLEQTEVLDDVVGSPIWGAVVAQKLHQEIATIAIENAKEMCKSFGHKVLLKDHLGEWVHLMKNIGTEHLNLLPRNEDISVVEVAHVLEDIGYVVRSMNSIDVAIFAFEKDEKLFIASTLPAASNLVEVKEIPMNPFTINEAARTLLVRKFVETFIVSVGGAGKPLWALTDCLLGTRLEDAKDINFQTLFEAMDEETMRGANEAMHQVFNNGIKNAGGIQGILGRITGEEK